jgi:hypothetical protein
MQTSETIAALAPALVKAQAAFGVAKKTATNPHFKTKYATLGDVMDAIKPALEAHGLAVLQGAVESDPTGFRLETKLLHSSGEWVASQQWFSGGTDIQKLGGVLTYARRYTLSALLGVVADEDDDGNLAAAPKAALARVVPSAPSSPTPTVDAPNGTDGDFQKKLPANPALGKFAGKVLNTLSVSDAKVVLGKVQSAESWRSLVDRYIQSKHGVPKDISEELGLEVIP